ncbi:MAG: Thioredoxin [Vampirovibrio sp.]|jgi:thiol:disulfide interchange protein|nr:Thioredoxin [Vampirovibrio sp.]
MSARLTATQNKVRLIAIFLFTVVLALAFQWFKAGVLSNNSSVVSQAETLDSSLFIGLRHASAAEVRAALPEAVGKPTLLDFSSKLCHDCKRMAPILNQLVPKYPNLYFRKIDVLTDAKKAPAIFRTFKPVSVPMLVFIDPNGNIRNVLYNYQKPETIAAAITKLERQSAAVRPKKTSSKTAPLSN